MQQKPTGEIMAKKHRLNKRTIEGFELPPEKNGRTGQAWFYDESTARLAVCVWSTGKRVWYWVGRFGSQVIRYKLGDYPEISPAQAKKLAAKASRDVSEGIDPRDKRRALREELTLSQLFAKYLEQYSKIHKRTWLEDEQSFARYCGQIKSRRLSAISKADVSALHRKIGKEHPIAANRLLTLLSSVFTWAANELELTVGNPVKGIKRFPEESRERFLGADELKRFFAALDEEPSIYRDFFLICVLTGARRGNVQSMRFEQIDFEGETWRIPKTKNNEPVTLPLAGPALDLLKERRADVSGPWVFPSNRKGQQHIGEPRVPWKRVLDRAGITDLHMHDLRRTLGSWQAGTGASLPIIGRSLGHKSTKATQIYARLDLDPVRASVDKAVQAMMGGKD